MTEEVAILPKGWVETDGLWFLTDCNDSSIYEHNLAVAKKVPIKIETAVDVGASIGYTTLPLARDGANVWSFEANPWAFSCLTEGAIRNRLVDRVMPFQLAVWPNIGNRFMAISSPFLSSPVGGMCQPEINPVIAITYSISFDEIANQIGKIDFLKIDIEGGEHLLVPSISKDAFDVVSYIYLEIHDVENSKYHTSGLKNADCKGVLDKAGFKQIAEELWGKK